MIFELLEKDHFIDFEAILALDIVQLILELLIEALHGVQ